MQNLLLKNIKLFRDLLQQEGQADQKVDYLGAYEKTKFIFRPNFSLKKQTKSFIHRYESDGWDGTIIFKGFKGTFKTEFWIFIESHLRNLENLSSISFIDTKLQKKHLSILKNWLIWLEPVDLKINLKQNELDDKDVESFIYDLINRQVSIDQILIVSNPGIFKGNFVKDLAKFLKDYQQPQFRYELIKDKSFYSIAIVRIKNSDTDEAIGKILTHAKHKIQSTYYYDLSFVRSFNVDNCAAFHHFIRQCYNEDNLEQLCSLDVSECELGSASQFTEVCTLMSMAKGLLKLSIRKQKQLDQAFQIEALTGDRYDQLRVNVLDISNNQSMTEKAFNVFAEKIITKGCKEYVVREGTLGQVLSTLVKMYYLDEAYKNVIKEFKRIQMVERRIPKLYVKTLDFSAVENYNRHDIISNILKSTIFTEFSSIKRFVMQNCDIGRMNAYIDAAKWFKNYIALKKQNNPLYQNYVSALKELTIPNQTYRMEEAVQKDLLLEMVFNLFGEVLQIETVKFNRCFRITGREEGFQAALDALEEKLKNDQNAKMTIKRLFIEDTSMSMSQKHVRFLLFNKQVPLEEFHFTKDEIAQFACIELMKHASEFLSTLEANKFHTLKKLVFRDVEGFQFELGSLIQVLIYHPNMRLEHLELIQIQSKQDDEYMDKLDMAVKSRSPENKFSLRTLAFGQFNGNYEATFFKQVLLTQFCEIENLTLEAQELVENLQNYRELLDELEKQQYFPFKRLVSLSLNRIQFKTMEEVQQCSSMLLFTNQFSLTTLTLKGININSNFTEGLTNSLASCVEKLNNSGELKNKSRPRLKSLSLIDCTLNEDILSIFISNMVCRLQSLIIQNCQLLTDSIIKTQKQLTQKIKEVNEAGQVIEVELKDLYTGFFREVQIVKSPIEIKAFKWFMEEIVFNFKRQKVSSLQLEACELTDDHIQVLSDIVVNLKSQSVIKGKRKKYHLRKIHLNDNPKISAAAWINLFNQIQEVLKAQEASEQDLKEDELKLEAQLKENQSYVYEQNLKLYEKQQSLPLEFPLIARPNLKILDLKMKFQEIGMEQQIDIYTQIIKGIILNPMNELEEIQLRELDLDMFMERCVSISEAYTKIQLGQNLPKQVSKLKSFTITSFQKQSDQSTEQFVRFFVCTDSINLKKLSTSGSSSKLIQQLLEQSKQKQVHTLEELELKSHKETLEGALIHQFLHDIVLGDVYPIKTISLENVQFNEEEGKLAGLDDLRMEYELEKKEIKLTNITLKLDQSQAIEKFSKLLLIILELHQSTLESLVLNPKVENKNPLQDVQESQNKQFKIKQLQLLYVVQFDIKFLEFLGKTRLALEELTVMKFKVAFDDQISNYIDNFQAPQGQVPTKIEVQKLEGTQFTQFHSKFLFCPKFAFESQIYKATTPLKELEMMMDFTKVKYLNLSSGLLYNSSEQLNEDALKLIAKNFIYNLESELTELLLTQNHFKPPGIKALTYPADDFRVQMAQQQKQQSAQLKLKRIQLYYSLYIGNEGFALFNKNLVYFEYINLEILTLQVLNMNDENAKSLCTSAQQWMNFQRLHNRKYNQHLPLQYLDISRNEFIQEQDTWNLLCDTFLFTERCPLLRTLNINFMSLNDVTVKYILHKASAFFNRKPSNYVYSVKRLNFSQNSALSQHGWAKISRLFFFHPKVELEEINLVSTMLDSPAKLEAVKSGLITKAMQKPNRKLVLHTFLCFNISLKSEIWDYLSEPPKDLKFEQDLAVQTDRNSGKIGVIDGIPESTGDYYTVVQQVLNYRAEFSNYNKWETCDVVRFPPFNYKFVDHFLKPLHRCQRQIANNRRFDLVLNTSTLDMLCKIYEYKIVYPGKPYPYNLLFQADFFTFIRSKECQINKIIIIDSKFPKLELISQMDVLIYWEQMKSKKARIDQVFIDYYLNDDLIDEMFAKQYTEKDLIELIRLFPPSRIRVENTISLQAIKGIYSILWDSHTFQYSNIQYDFDNFLNIGIGYALREMVYNKKPTFIFRSGIKKFLYKFFNLFVKKVDSYEFTDQITQLNTYLAERNFYFFLISINNIIFYAVCIVGPVILTKYYEGDEDLTKEDKYCLEGPSIYSSYAYAIFAAISCALEAFIHNRISQHISDHIKPYLEISIDESDTETEANLKGTNRIMPIGNNEEELLKAEQKDENRENAAAERKDVAVKATTVIFKSIKQQANNLGHRWNDLARSKLGQFVIYLAFLVYAQVEKLDLFNDVAFIITCYYCKEYNIFLAYLVITAAGFVGSFLNFVGLVASKLRRKTFRTKLLSTSNINDFCEISAAGKNSFLADILYDVAPFNVSVIPNNFLTRFFFPNQAGKSINNQVKNSLMQIVFEDFPQVILLMYFTIKQSLTRGESIQVQIYITIITALLSLVMAFWTVMSIRPSSLSQDDFDKLSQEKKKQLADSILNLAQQEKTLLDNFSNYGTNPQEAQKNVELL